MKITNLETAADLTSLMQDVLALNSSPYIIATIDFTALKGSTFALTIDISPAEYCYESAGPGARGKTKDDVAMGWPQELLSPINKRPMPFTLTVLNKDLNGYMLKALARTIYSMFVSMR